MAKTRTARNRRSTAGRLGRSGSRRMRSEARSGAWRGESIGIGVLIFPGSSVPASGWPEKIQHFARMAPGVHLREGVTDRAVRADHVRDPLRGRILRAGARPVGHADLPPGVAQQAVWEAEFLREFGILLHAVERRSQDHDVFLLELRRQVAVPATLDGSPGRVGLREEPQDDGLTLELTEGNFPSLLVLDLEIGRFRSDLQHRGPPRLARLDRTSESTIGRARAASEPAPGAGISISIEGLPPLPR